MGINLNGITIEHYNTYLGEKERFALALRVGIITRGQYESALKYHIKNHLRDGLVTKRHKTPSAVAYNKFLNASSGHGSYNSRDYYIHGGTARCWLDSLVTKPRRPLVWAED